MLRKYAVVNEESSRDLLSYTKCWMDKVNRGSLFPLNDQSFRLFVEMEKNTILLPSYVIGKSTSMQTLDDLVKKITSDEEVQFLWTLLSQDVEPEEDSQQLLYTGIFNRICICMHGWRHIK